MSFFLILNNLVTVDKRLALLIGHRDNYITQSHVIVKVRVVRDTAAHTDEEDVLHTVKCSWKEETILIKERCAS